MIRGQGYFKKTYPMGDYPILQADLDEIRENANSIKRLVIKPIAVKNREVWLLEIEYTPKVAVEVGHVVES